MLRRKLTTLILSAMPYLVASSADTPERVEVLIRPECERMFRFSDDRDAIGRVKNYGKPLTFKDQRTQITFYVESDGRHLAAIDTTRGLLWVRNPFEEARLCPYRHVRPVISRIEVADISRRYLENLAGTEAAIMLKNFSSNSQYIRIHFDSSQFGIVEVSSGLFALEGQN